MNAALETQRTSRKVKKKKRSDGALCVGEPYFYLSPSEKRERLNFGLDRKRKETTERARTRLGEREKREKKIEGRDAGDQKEKIKSRCRTEQQKERERENSPGGNQEEHCRVALLFNQRSFRYCPRVLAAFLSSRSGLRSQSMTSSQ